MAKKTDYLAEIELTVETLRYLIEAPTKTFGDCISSALLKITKNGIISYGANSQMYAVGAVAVSKGATINYNVKEEYLIDIGNLQITKKILDMLKATNQETVTMKLDESMLVLKSGNLRKSITNCRTTEEGRAPELFRTIQKFGKTANRVGTIPLEDLEKYMKGAAHNPHTSTGVLTFKYAKNQLSIITDLHEKTDTLSIDLTIKDGGKASWKGMYCAKELEMMMHRMGSVTTEITLRTTTDSPLIISSRDTDPCELETFEEGIVCHFAIAPRLEQE